MGRGVHDMPCRVSSKISGAFTRASLGPLQYAAGLVTSNKVREGLEELAGDALTAGVERGIADVAKLVGLPPSAVRELLPTEELTLVALRIANSQAKAIAAWRLHAGETGLFDLVTALTIDGRTPEAGLALERMARKLSIDRELSGPLDALARDVTDWEDLLVRCRHILEDRDVLANAYKRRRTRLITAVIIPALLLLSTLLVTSFVFYKRGRVDDRLAVADPCAARLVDPGDARYASSAQQRAIETKTRTCADIERAARERERVEAELLAAEEKKRSERAAYEASCEKLGDDLSRGVDGGFAFVADSEERARLGRIARKSLLLADIGPSDPKLPCADTPALKKLEAAYGAALLTDVSLWTQQTEASPLVERLLIAQKDSLPLTAVMGIADYGERTAKSGLTGGKPEVIQRAKKFCGLARKLGVPGHGSCHAVEALP